MFLKIEEPICAGIAFGMPEVSLACLLCISAIYPFLVPPPMKLAFAKWLLLEGAPEFIDGFPGLLKMFVGAGMLLLISQTN